VIGQSVTLNVVPGIYDLLKLSNGGKKIATDTLEISKVQQIRLILEQETPWY
jgi:hydrogenase maturation factor HypE